MQFSTLATALFASLVAAAPAPNAAEAVEQRTEPAWVNLHFWAAADTGYDLAVKADGRPVYTYNPLSITYISSNAPYGVTCKSHGIDNIDTFVVGDAKNVPVGPPQTQVWVSCYY